MYFVTKAAALNSPLFVSLHKTSKGSLMPLSKSWRKGRILLAAYADVLDYYMYPEDVDFEDYDFGEVGGGLTERA